MEEVVASNVIILCRRGALDGLKPGKPGKPGRA